MKYLSVIPDRDITFKDHLLATAVKGDRVGGFLKRTNDPRDNSIVAGPSRSKATKQSRRVQNQPLMGFYSGSAIHLANPTLPVNLVTGVCQLIFPEKKRLFSSSKD